MRFFFQLVLLLVPWIVRRRILNAVFGYDIHPSARIGISLIMPRVLSMAEGSRIGHLTIAKGLDRIELGIHSRIGNLNWITGFPSGGARFFLKQPERMPGLFIRDHAAIQNRNLIDCTDRIVIGRFSRVAGFWHQFLTHSIDLTTANQASAPISIGEYCFVGTGAMLLKGSALPDFSVLGAGSVLHKKHEQTHKLYSGTPAVAVKDLDRDLAFFRKTKGDSD